MRRNILMVVCVVLILIPEPTGITDIVGILVLANLLLHAPWHPHHRRFAPCGCYACRTGLRRQQLLAGLGPLLRPVAFQRAR